MLTLPPHMIQFYNGRSADNGHTKQIRVEVKMGMKIGLSQRALGNIFSNKKFKKEEIFRSPHKKLRQIQNLAINSIETYSNSAGTFSRHSKGYLNFRSSIQTTGHLAYLNIH